MVKTDLNILHIDTEKYWRGGQQQVLYLHEGLILNNFESLLICNKSSELKNKCVEKGLPFNEISIFGELDIISAFKIAKICKSRKINIIHAHSAHALSIGIYVKILSPKLKLIASRRVDFSIARNFLSKIKYNNKKVDKIVCISEYIKNVLINDGIEKSKLVTIRSGADIHKFDNVKTDKDFKEKLGVLPGEILVGTVAAFAGHKDYPTLLHAFSMALGKIKNIKLCIVGDGPLKDKVEEMIQNLGISNNVIMPGFRKDIGKFLKSFDIFVLSSKKEGLGTSIIDALSVGLPVIATEAGGIPELIENDVNGRLAPIKSPIDLSKIMVELIEDESARKRLSGKAKQSAINFSIENNIAQNIELYKELIGKN